MHKISQLGALLIQNLKHSLSRFPETITTALVFTVIAIIQNHGYTSDLYDHMLLGLVIGGVLFAIGVLIQESLHFGKAVRTGVDIGILALTALYIYLIPNDLVDAWVYRYMALLGLLLGVFMILPYWYKRQGFSKYVLYLLGRGFLTLLYGLVLFLGLSAIAFALETLFVINIGDAYFDLFLISMVVFGVTYFLGNVPALEDEMTLAHYSKIFKSIFLYIALPVMGGYTLILHAYFIKLLFDGSLPEGMIGTLVLWHGVITTVTLFFLRDVQAEKTWLKAIYKFYPLAMIIPLAMLFVAIGIRINAYGLTISRYLVVALGLFILLTTLISRFKKQDPSVAVMTLFLVMLGISFFGILSGPSLALKQQNDRFEDMLISAGVYDEVTGNFRHQDVSDDQSRNLTRQYRYLERTYGKEAIDLIPSDMTAEDLSIQTGLAFEYGVVESIEAFYVNQVANNDTFIPVEGALWVAKIDTRSELTPVHVTEAITLEKTMIYSGQDSHDELTVKLDGQVVQSLNMTEWVKDMAIAYHDSMRDTKVLAIGDQSISVTLQVFNYRGNGQEDHPSKVDYYTAYLIIGLVND